MGEKVGSVAVSFLVLPNQEVDKWRRVHFRVIYRECVEKMKSLW